MFVEEIYIYIYIPASILLFRDNKQFHVGLVSDINPVNAIPHILAKVGNTYNLYVYKCIFTCMYMYTCMWDGWMYGWMDGYLYVHVST